MLIGYNNDVQYRGKKFHIQTEDHGRNDPRIESQIFHQGQILDTEIVSYAAILKQQDGDEVDHKLKSLMWAAHKGLYRKLMSGVYDERVGLEPVEAPEEEVEAPAPEEFEPGQDRVPSAARKIEEQGEEAVEQFHENQARKHVDLDSLKDHLSGIDESGQDEQEAAASSSTPAAEGSGAGASGLGGAPQESGLDSFDSSTGGEPTADQLLQEEEESRAGAESGAGEVESIEVAGGAAVAEVGQTATAETEGKDGGAGDDGGAKPRSNSENTPSFAHSGESAWQGCEPPQGSVDVVPLIEEFIEN